MIINPRVRAIVRELQEVCGLKIRNGQLTLNLHESELQSFVTTVHERVVFDPDQRKPLDRVGR